MRWLSACLANNLSGDYYVNPTIAAANAVAKRTLSPQGVDGLVFARTPSGQEVLAAAMYLLPPTVAIPPMPYGPLGTSGTSEPTCAGLPPLWVTSTLLITGVTPCACRVPSRKPPLT